MKNQEIETRIENQLHNEIFNPSLFDLRELVEDLERSGNLSLKARVLKRNNVVGSLNILMNTSNLQDSVMNSTEEDASNTTQNKTACNLKELIEIDLNLRI